MKIALSQHNDVVPFILGFFVRPTQKSAIFAKKAQKSARVGFLSLRLKSYYENSTFPTQ